MTQAEIREKNIERVRQIALSCILEYGVNRTSYELLSEKSGLTTRTLRRYFRNKTELLCDVLCTVGVEKYQKKCEDLLKTIPESANGITQIQMLCRRIFEATKHDKSALLLISELELYFYENKVSGAFLKKYLQKLQYYRKYLRQYLRKGIGDGSIRPDIDADMFATNMANTYIGLLQRMYSVRYAREMSEMPSVEEQAELYIRTLTSFLSPGNEIQMYQSVLDNSQEIIQVHDEASFELLYVNLAGKQYAGYDDYAGKRCYEYFLEREKPCDFCPMAGGFHEFTEEIVSPDGKSFYRIKGKRTLYFGRSVWIEYVADVTEKE